MKLLLGSLVAEVNGIGFPLDEAHSGLARFVTEGRADFAVDTVVRSIADPEFCRAVVSRGGREVTFDRTTSRAVVDLDRRRVSLVLSGPWTPALDLVLRPVTQVMALELRRGAVFHASAVVGDGLAAVLVGRSGAGKTTAAILARQAGAELISEELTYVGLEAHGARLHTLPFREKNRLSLPVPGAYPLPALYVLQQDDRDAVEPLPRSERVRQLLACAVVAVQDRAFTLPALEVCEALAQRVPVRRLRFRNTPAFWQLVVDDLRATVGR